MFESLNLTLKKLREELDNVAKLIADAEIEVRSYIPFENKYESETGRVFSNRASDLRRKEYELLRRESSLILLLEGKKLSEMKLE